MMKRKRGKHLEVICMELGELVPENHLHKQISTKLIIIGLYWL